MPADQLNPSTATRPAQPAALPNEMAEGVLAVLAGSPLDQVAAGLGVQTADLTDAIETYQQAGHAALETQAATHDWYQVHVQFPEWAAAEKAVVTGLGPQLQRLQDTGVIAAWWFIRKTPCWRLRLQPGYDVERAEMKTSLDAILDGLTTAGLISRWRQTFYEPETVAFGGQPGMGIAHDLFCADSRNILAYLRRPEPTMGRRELSVLLCGALFRAAEQEWFECGNIWHHVARLRPIPAETPPDRRAVRHGRPAVLRRVLGHRVPPSRTSTRSSGQRRSAGAGNARHPRSPRDLPLEPDRPALQDTKHPRPSGRNRHLQLIITE